MKAIVTLSIICLLSVFSCAYAQETKSDTTKQMNLMNEQVKIFSSVLSLGGSEQENPFNGATNYTELIEKSDMPAEQKQQLLEIYSLYDTSLDPKKKEELKIKVNRMLEEAMDKSLSEE